MPDELKPCPFCAKQQSEFRDGSRRDVPGIYIWCSSCGAQGRLFTYDPIIASGKSLAKDAAIAAWNHRQSQPEALAGQGEKLAALREAAQALLDRMSSTYKARNGREMGIQGDDGEKCWIVHSDDVEELRRALASLQSGGQSERGMIVEWLRNPLALSPEEIKAAHYFADAIERGDFLPNPKGEG